MDTMNIAGMTDAGAVEALKTQKETERSEKLAELGKRYYEAHRDDAGAEYRELIEEITAASDAAAECGSRLMKLNGLVQCEQCGAQVKETHYFCIKCGHPLRERPAPEPQPDPEPQPEQAEPVCPNCGSTMRAGMRFCTRCGSPMDAAPAAPVEAVPAKEAGTVLDGAAEQAVTASKSSEPADPADDAPTAPKAAVTAEPARTVIGAPGIPAEPIAEPQPVPQTPAEPVRPEPPQTYGYSAPQAPYAPANSYAPQPAYQSDYDFSAPAPQAPYAPANGYAPPQPAPQNYTVPASASIGSVCPMCSSPLKPGAKFCTHCGANLEVAQAYRAQPQENVPRFCRTCGQKIVSPTTKFCTKCGTML